MKFSVGWLKEFLEAAPEDDELARRLTAVGFAVEGIEAKDGDVVFDVDVTTNRPDAMCHLGLAREAAAGLGRPLRPPEIDLPEGGPVDPGLVTIEARSLCRRYVGWVIREVRIGPSPGWLARRLEAIGLRPINNVVDATNYVLWELGQPLHAFDRAKLAEGRIVVRHAAGGEGIRTLDGEERELTPEMLVIADAERPIALAGVMGGEETEVGGSTAEVLLESAWFEPGAVRRTAGELGIHTDASHRFERGADPEAALAAAARAVDLIRELTGGVPEEAPLDVRGESPPSPARIHLDPTRLDRFAGTEISTDETRRSLVSLGFGLEAAEDASGWAVEVPSWRRFDVLEEADLMEEVLRIVGFDRIPSRLPAVEGPDAPELPSHRLRRSVQDHLSACGYAEAVSYAFYGDEEDSLCRPWADRGEPVKLSNPLSERYDRMRRTLIPGLVSSARFNRRRDREAVALFELGHVFWRGEDDEPRETEHVALAAGGRLGNPWEGPVDLDFYDLKGVSESLLARLGLEATMEPVEIPGLVKGATAEWRDRDGVRVGVLGRLDEEDPLYPLFAAEIALPSAGSVPRGRAMELPSRYPGITMDVTLTHPEEVAWQEISETVAEARVQDLISFALKDRYEGEGVPEGCVNTTITFHYRAEDRSLTQEEINDRQEALTGVLTERFGREEET